MLARLDFGWTSLVAWAGGSKSSTTLRAERSILEGTPICLAPSSPRTELDREVEPSAPSAHVNFDDFLYVALAQNVPTYSSSSAPPRLTRGNARTFCVGGSSRNDVYRSGVDGAASSLVSLNAGW